MTLPERCRGFPRAFGLWHPRTSLDGSRRWKAVVENVEAAMRLLPRGAPVEYVLLYQVLVRAVERYQVESREEHPRGFTRDLYGEFGDVH